MAERRRSRMLTDEEREAIRRHREAFCAALAEQCSFEEARWRADEAAGKEIVSRVVRVRRKR